ncbi:MAG: hypothetical protein P8X90_28695 [Desulfobacterales bacterium]
MEAKKINHEGITVLDLDSGIINEERSLILLKSEPRKNIDETISTPDKYVSRYHYETKDLGNFLELCPHCRKPSILAFRKRVIDSAIDYLNEKQELRERRSNRRRIALLVVSLMGIAAGAYYLFFHVISGFRL